MKIEIAENKEEFFSDFIHLNGEWISTYFEIEEVDRKLAANLKRVIEDGGYIFSLLANNEVVGVCALFYEGNGIYELARMAVAPNHHGIGHGKLLIQTCLSKLEEIKAKKVHLVSNTKLETAIALYRKFGFETTSQEQHPVYARANITMERTIS
jgi:putative acetyltransferase